ncbi:MAG: cyclohexanecarboxylate-CoA ligase [Marmoricola sp.]|nr:cyclohexanecarboxylate-CoA ligase [Marmoricola sp.]
MTGPWPWMIGARTLDDLIALRARTTPDAPLLVDESGTTVTCREFADRAERVAAALAAEGIGRGSRVSWQLPTRISALLVLAALRRLDAVQAPMITQYRTREVAVALATSRAEYYLVPGAWQGFDYGAMAAGIAADAPGAHVIEIGHDAPEADPGASFDAGSNADPETVAWIYFTSGSTGAPKGARHTDGTLLAAATAFAGGGRLGEQPGEVAAMGFPVAHIGGVVYLIAALAGGYPVLVQEAFVPDRATADYRRFGVTTTGGAPAFYSALLTMARAVAPEKLVPGLRTLKGGGAACPPEMFGAVRDELGAVLAHDYGMTEVPMIAVADPTDDPAVLAATDGRVIPGNTVRILDPSGQACPSGVLGEIQVSGWAVCRGYTDPTETQKAFTADGWFRTGDLGLLYPSGHVEVVGRLKDIINRKGENIAPQEIEELLATHPAVAEVAVIGVPDGERGELVCAIVTPSDPGAPPALPDLVAHLDRAGLMRQKFPERLEIVGSLPRTGLAKVAKSELRDRFSSPRTDERQD